jgi:uncharacterized protein (DUF433 family)
MSKFDWSDCPGVERDPERCGGALTFKGTRSTVSSVLANIGDGGIDGVVSMFDIPREQIEDVLDFLVESCRAPVQSPTTRL